VTEIDQHALRRNKQCSMIHPISSHRRPVLICVFFFRKIFSLTTTGFAQRPTNRPFVISFWNEMNYYDVLLYCLDILDQFLPKKSARLELFARNLLPGWTSWGNEVRYIFSCDLTCGYLLKWVCLVCLLSITLSRQWIHLGACVVVQKSEVERTAADKLYTDYNHSGVIEVVASK